MKKTLSLLCLGIGLLSCMEKTQVVVPVVQEPVLLDSLYLSSKTRYFTVQDKQLDVEGDTIWGRLLNDAQFVVFGERHSSARISELISALVPKLSQADYRNIAFEIGPHSAQKLRELSLRSDNTINALKAFNDRYFNEEMEMEAIPFFYGLEDAEFLKRISASKIHFWGVDQEFFYAAHFLNDELLRLAAGKPNIGEIKARKRKLDERLDYWYAQSKTSDEEIDVFGELQKEAVLEAYFSVFNERDVKARSIIHDLKFSWDIYSRWRSGSHADRVSYMRNQFMDNYEHAMDFEKFPKVFLKLGQAHASQIISNGAYDLGHMCNELAQKNGTRSVNINSWTSYFREDGTESNYLQKRSYYKRLKDFTCLADRNRWAIIDLESIRSDVEKGFLLLPQNGDFHDINALINAYDYQLIIPLDHYPTDNRTVVDQNT